MVETPAPVRPRRSRSRRNLLLVLGIVVLVPVSLVAAVLTTTYVRASTDTVGAVEFDRPLAVPPLEEGRTDGAGRRVFDLTLQQGETDFGMGGPAETWGVDGTYLGPTLRMARDERVLVNVTNELGETTTLHWHGMHLPAAMDGGPHQPIATGSTWSPTWTVDQPAATLWYHPHLHGSTADHVHRGLAGMVVLDDAEASALALPSTYGVDDVPVIVQDRSFLDDGRFDDRAPWLSPGGFLGDTLLVNGTVGPYLDVTTERVRLRLLNASHTRPYAFRLADDRPLAVVGTDGGLLPAPVETEVVQLSPGERAEVVVTLTPGERVVLRSDGVDQGVGFPFGRLSGGDDRFDVLELRAAERLAPSPPVPARLAPAPSLDLDAPVDEVRSFRLSGTQIDGRDMDLARIDEVVTVGSTERWEVTNGDGQPHNVHVHGASFRVVSGGRAAYETAGWKDTVLVPPNEGVDLLMRFDGPTDPDLPFMIHCHLLRHEDGGMMAQFVVVRPGEEAGTPPVHEHEAGAAGPRGAHLH